jgi:hypothetical protein
MVSLVLVLLFSLGRVLADLLVILLEGGEVLASLRELALLHALTDVPVDEGTLGVHKVELVVETAPSGRDGGGVRQHAQAARHLGKVTAGDECRSLVTDTELEPGRAPVDELDGTLRLDAGHGTLGLLRRDLTTVEQAAGHCDINQTMTREWKNLYELYLPSFGSHLTI